MNKLNYLSFLVIILTLSLNGLNCAFAEEKQKLEYFDQTDPEFIPKRAHYLMLEKKADTRYEESFQSNWMTDLYKIECFFRDTVEIYERAENFAKELHMYKDAVRIQEKQAMIWAEKLERRPGFKNRNMQGLYD